MATRATWVACGMFFGLVGCTGPLKEYEQYSRDMCSCTNYKCVQDVEARYSEMLHRPATFVEKHFVSAGAEKKIVDAINAAEACELKYLPTQQTCGGPAAIECPSGFR